MEVKGEAMLSIPIFIIKKYGTRAYNRWLELLTQEARKVYSSPINKSDWYPLKEMMTEPTQKICKLFYNNSLKGAWDCGRYSAEYGLKGVYKVLVKLCSPETLIKKGAAIIQNYYKPCELEITEESKNHVIVHINSFPEIDAYIEHRIAGWMQRATEICGCKHVSIKITKSLTQNDYYTEYCVSWR